MRVDGGVALLGAPSVQDVGGGEYVVDLGLSTFADGDEVQTITTSATAHVTTEATQIRRIRTRRMCMRTREQAPSGASRS